MASQGKLSAVSLRTSVWIQDGLVPAGVGGAPLSGGRGGPGGAGQACFQGIQAQILTWPTQSPLPQHEPHHEPTMTLFYRRAQRGQVTCSGSLVNLLPGVPSSGGLWGACGSHFLSRSTRLGASAISDLPLGQRSLYCYFLQLFSFPSGSSLWTGLGRPGPTVALQ